VGDVFVTDTRDDHVVFDVLKPRVELADIVGKQAELLTRLGRVTGVTVMPGASVHSNGVLGVIGTPESDIGQTLSRATETDMALRTYVSSRIAVISTGPEVVAGNIEDTNLAAIADVVGHAGFEVTSAGAVFDDEDAIMGRVLRLASEGFGVIITTGGVGAEDKDRTIEALQRCDPELATDVLATYTVGHGRHVKPHVRIGVGRVRWTRLIALPGPTREVKAALPILLRGLDKNWDSRSLALALGEALRECLRTPSVHQ
jgi:molybdenum cofactor synthesis domain-containing protein